ncbi:hypothetical protein BO71DRAFT_458139 [Aspergillus ellipticus CBS 707.79]|uniref:Uncharacterized protein n=1 Tax=Aspergillus ellipticus CBS 707.79 TaxID=1448320 RepID=A0A319ECU4_9EURO|nr:hypothetical protein BO71DRAFT_458139 [Aspergillus ellipticus CBS 707.79]
MFDHVLLLAPGGRTVYFGETGSESKHVIDYFSRNGATMGLLTTPPNSSFQQLLAKAKEAKTGPEYGTTPPSAPSCTRKSQLWRPLLQMPS